MPSPFRVRAVALLTMVTAALTVTAGSLPAAASTGSAGHPHRSARLVVLGDSFASGEGTFRYRRGTDTTDNQCHRSDLAYGAILGSLPKIGPARVVACSGASTLDLVQPNDQNVGEAAQLDALGSSTRRVTLGIGGNDIGFSTVLGVCIATARQLPCSANPTVTNGVAFKLAALAGQLPPGVTDPTVVPVTTLLADISRRAPRAEITVVGYPHLFGADRSSYQADPSVASQYSCAVDPTGTILSPAGPAVLGLADAQWINATTDSLNAVLAGAAAAAQAQGASVRFVTPTTFAGHGLCDAKRSWINPLLLTAQGTPRSESFHPTVRGQLGFVEALVRAEYRRY